MKQGRDFMWLDKFSAVMEKLNTEEEKAEFALAIMMYGCRGEETDLPYPLNALFETIREDIDNAVIEE